MLSQFKKKTFCSDLDQRHLFRSVCPINNGNYGINLHALFINSHSCKTFRVANSPTRKRCGNNRVVKGAKPLAARL